MSRVSIRFNGDVDLLRGECIEQHLLDLGVHRECTHLLAARSAVFTVIAGADIHWIVPGGPGVVQAHTSPAAAAECDALQKRLPLTRHTGLVALATQGVA